MNIENLNILSAWWFIFFLLIILFWYIFVEILMWEKYFYRSVLEKYNNNLFDRLVHYVSWWIILNIGLFFFNAYSDKWLTLANLFNNSVNMAKPLEQLLWENNSIQFILFSLWYFIVFLIIAYSIKLIIYCGIYIFLE